MKLTIMPVSAAVLMASPPVVLAQGASNRPPGTQFQRIGSRKEYPGASGYAPGQRMQKYGSRKGHPGASGYAPGQTTGMGGGSMSTGSRTGGSGMGGTSGMSGGSRTGGGMGGSSGMG